MAEEEKPGGEVRALYYGVADVCPFCGYDDVQGKGVDVEGIEARQECSCSECETRWTNLYQLSHFVWDRKDTMDITRGMGARASKEDRPRVPIMDPFMTSIIAGWNVDEGKETRRAYLRAWLIGWDTENLGPVPGQ